MGFLILNHDSLGEGIVIGLDLLIETALYVKKRVCRALKTPEAKRIEGIGASGDVTKKIDVVAEKAAIKALKEGGFNGIVVSEESGFVRMGDGNYLVLLDPLDGTTNAIKGIRFYSISIAFARERRLSSVESAVVLDLCSNDIYTAEKGGGAYLNFKPIETSKQTRLDDAVVGIDLSGKVSSSRIPDILKLCSLTNHIRHFGSIALELCLIASGALDAFVDLRNMIRPIDIAAGKLILEEAGGLMLDLDGKPLDCDVDVKNRVSFLACCTKELGFEILKVVRG
ncbi:MAG: fructose 1,6-bisphosphatase [Candidatus Methanomethylicota archaeon]|uniref:Fructose 1,6-bisphosphatase n=1 Tax=Thermoproteota archaeon TaxID=2056631 RepID=A0A497EUN0_9CREN|nr:MAG: fructose 1,6-bisphosphatase [Candidatus Verstraetearchaeota archaeon]